MCYLVRLNKHEVECFVKVFLTEHGFFDHLVGHAPLHVKHQLQHLIVGFAREKNLPRVNLKNSTSHSPEVNHSIISSANDYKKMSTYNNSVSMVYIQLKWCVLPLIRNIFYYLRIIFFIIKYLIIKCVIHAYIFQKKLHHIPWKPLTYVIINID